MLDNFLFGYDLLQEVESQQIPNIYNQRLINRHNRRHMRQAAHTRYGMIVSPESAKESFTCEVGWLPHSRSDFVAAWYQKTTKLRNVGQLPDPVLMACEDTEHLRIHQVKHNYLFATSADAETLWLINFAYFGYGID